MKRRRCCGRGKYGSTNSGPAARACRSWPSDQPGSLSPPPFPFEHPTQGLTAGGAAKLLAGTATTRHEVLVTARTIAAKNFGFLRWALTLAGPRRAGAGGLRRGRKGLLGCGSLPAFGAAAAIPPVLSLPFLPPLGGLPIVPAGASLPPSPSSGPAFWTAISGLGVSGTKGFFASLEQTAALSRPTSPLTDPGIAASW